MSANNFYQMSTATTIQNSGTGSNTLAKPAGSEVASIVPGKKYSSYIASSATFTTDFNADVSGFSVSMYVKPNVGNVLSVAGHTVTYSGHSYVLTNEIGEKVEIPVSSHRAVFLVFTHSAMEAGISVDGVGASIPSNTLESPGPLPVTLLGTAGGILEHVSARSGVISQYEIESSLSSFFANPAVADDVLYLSDANRQFTVITRVSDAVSVEPWSEKVIELPATDSLAFKVVYKMTGPGRVSVNGAVVKSGVAILDNPTEISIFAEEETVVVSEIDVVEYYSTELGSTHSADITTTGGTGHESPIHWHDDSAGTSEGETTVLLDETAAQLSGWFFAQDGAPLPGVTMAAGVLTGTNIFVNGKPYVPGTVVRDWYFLVKTQASVTGSFVIDVPVQALVVDESSMTASQIDDLYESFLGNPVLTTPAETMTVSEMPAMIITTEWSIVSSG